MVYTLVIVRHGESTWNKENIFTGWTDVGLTDLGEREAVEAGIMLKEKNYNFDIAYTSVLKRAVHTLWTVLKELDQSHVPIVNSWRLNERHYGALQGLNKSETAAKHGEDQVKVWRRSYDVPPPSLEITDPRCPSKEVKYHHYPKDILPNTECLKDTVERVIPYWFDAIAPSILSGKRVIISAHGNSIRGLIKHLDNISDDAIVELNVPTGIPLIYELDDDLKPIRHYYLGDEAAIQAKMAAVAAQGKAK